MKFIAMILALSSVSSFAATVHSAKLDASEKNILVDVSYSGGCKEHVFKLKLGACMETYPVQCKAELVEKVVNGPDLCEAIVGKTVKINLAKYKLDDSYFAGGSLTITGDKDMSGKPSKATVVLP